MARRSRDKKSLVDTVLVVADTASWFCALLLLALMLLSSQKHQLISAPFGGEVVWGGAFAGRPCDEIYVVGEGETLHTISDKCGDPFIVERNPHINDPDDVFPGLVIKIIPSNPVKN